PARRRGGPRRTHHPHALPPHARPGGFMTPTHDHLTPGSRVTCRERHGAPDSHGDERHESFPLRPSLLFCPGDRPDRFDKAADRAYAVILDHEDAVNPGSKRTARDAVVAHGIDPARTNIRINAP